ncbi:nucleotidyltransferase domain-containing protein [Egicoccus sp. AB-alg2]|uniref:nucleotidyltransferase domain-containing protein n=1 Tax=Egicoccus sp. AB-alg2 TaxID=3242693 RepID=UPI00359EEEA8
MRDPREGVAADGTIVTGADAAHLDVAFAPVVDDAVSRLRAEVGASLHGIYLYGSVATGQAVVARSDLDLIVVLRTTVDAALGDVAAEVGRRHRDVVRGVAVGTVTFEDFWRPDPAAAADRCFLRHYTVYLAGEDLRPTLPACRPSTELAVGFNGDLGAVLADVRRRLETTTDPAARAALEVRVCRKLLMAAATLLSVETGGWSTDRATGAALVARVAPALRASAEAALRRSEEGAGLADEDELLRLVDGLGAWLVDRYRAAGS